MADNDNENPARLRAALAAHMDGLSSDLADALRCTVDSQDDMAGDAMRAASAEMRGVIAVVKHLEPGLGCASSRTENET